MIKTLRAREKTFIWRTLARSNSMGSNKAAGSMESLHVTANATRISSSANSQPSFVLLSVSSASISLQKSTHAQNASIFAGMSVEVVDVRNINSEIVRRAERNNNDLVCQPLATSIINLRKTHPNTNARMAISATRR